MARKKVLFCFIEFSPHEMDLGAGPAPTILGRGEQKARNALSQSKKARDTIRVTGLFQPYQRQDGVPETA